jgi:isocitrate/isopropylmalate dehydrogenase
MAKHRIAGKGIANPIGAFWSAAVCAALRGTNR